MGVNQDHNTLVRVLKRVILDAGEREEWREVLGEAFYHAAAEFLVDFSEVGDEDLGSQFADYVRKHQAIVVPLAVVEAVWTMTGDYDPLDARHSANQPKVAVEVPANVAAAFQA